MDLRPALMMETASLLLRPLELSDVPFFKGNLYRQGSQMAGEG